ncbi:MAG: hypothetical protein ACI4UK_00545 [Floccifex sp.]
MEEKIYFTTNDAIFASFRNCKEKGSIIKDSQKGYIYKMTTSKKLDYFDFGVLMAMNTLYLNYENKRINYEHIKKLITGNKTARLSDDCKKESTVSKNVIIKSLQSLNKTSLKIELEEKKIVDGKLIDIELNEDGFSFNACPLLLRLYKGYGKILGLNLFCINSQILTYRKGKLAMNPNHDNIVAKIYILANILCGKEEIDLNHVKDLYGYNKRMAYLNNCLKKYPTNAEKIKKSIYKETKKFNKIFLNLFMSEMFDHQIISKYEINKMQINVHKM